MVPLFLLYVEEFEVTVAIGKPKGSNGHRKLFIRSDDAIKPPSNSIDSNQNKQQNPKTKQMLGTMNPLTIDLAKELYKINALIEKDKDYSDSGNADFKEEEDEEPRVANYEQLVGRRLVKLPGELGRGHKVTNKIDKEREKIGYDKHAFNEVVSEKISVYRRLKDYRNKK